MSNLQKSFNKSHPIRVRGLKFLVTLVLVQKFFVAPHTGAWIEIINDFYIDKSLPVAPHTGAWIEIFHLF